MELSRASTVYEVRGALMKKGETIADWARRSGFNPIFASRYLLRWGGKKGRPRGEKTRAVIEALEAETGIRICG